MGRLTGAETEVHISFGNMESLASTSGLNTNRIVIFLTRKKGTAHATTED
jgi:hypothetical protein